MASKKDLNDMVQQQQLQIDQLQNELRLTGISAQAYGDMVRYAISALNYIKTRGNSAMPDENQVRLLDAMGVPFKKADEAKADKPEKVADECLGVITDLNKKLAEYRAEIQKDIAQIKAQKEKKKKKVEEIAQVMLQDGQVIPITTDFDAFFHKCCDCGLIHEVHVDWSDVPLQPEQRAVLETRWFRRESLPTKEELEEAGHKVIPFEQRDETNAQVVSEDKDPDAS